MLAGQHDAPVDPAHVLVMRGALLRVPCAKAAIAPRHAMPADADAVLELRRVLRMDLRTHRDDFLQAPRRIHRGVPERIAGEHIGAEQHALAAQVAAVIRVRNLRDRQVGIADSAVDALVLLPEPAPELQARLQRSVIRQCIDRGLQLCRDPQLELAQDRDRQSADAPVGLRDADRAVVAVRIIDRDPPLVLVDLEHPRVVADQGTDLAREGLRDPVHAAHRLENGGLHVVALPGRNAGPQARLQQLRQIERL